LVAYELAQRVIAAQLDAASRIGFETWLHRQKKKTALCASARRNLHW